MSGKPTKVFGFTREIFLKRLKAGENQKDIANSFNVPYQVIQFYRKKFGLPPFKSPKYTTTCSYLGCNKKVHGLGLCNLHYKRVKTHGDPSIRLIRNKGEGTLSSGYWSIKVNGKKKLTHVLAAEKALGKPLSKGVEVHHVDLNRSNDRNNNLVVCQDRTYHKLLHKRTKERRNNVLDV